MSTPTLIHLWCLFAVYLLQLTVGYQIAKNAAVKLAWVCLLIAFGFIVFVFNVEQPLLKMLAIIITTFTAMKIVVVAESYRDKPFKLNFFQWLMFAAGWVGMRPHAFETVRAGNMLSGGWLLVKRGIARVVFGLLLLALAHFTAILPVNATLLFIVNSGIMLVGLSLILHFGFLSISAGLWRFLGADTYLLFRQPANSKSLTEFWGKRWNLAFIEMLSIAVLRPLKTRIGNTAAILLSFLLSGLLHEVAITLPVNAGFGMPIAYFIIQGFAVVAEKQMKKQNVAILNNWFVAKLWLLFWLLAPISLLFPKQFIEEIIQPLANLNL